MPLFARQASEAVGEPSGNRARRARGLPTAVGCLKNQVNGVTLQHYWNHWLQEQRIDCLKTDTDKQHFAGWVGSEAVRQ